MDCRVISISRALASGGEEAGRKVAEELGFRYVDDEIVTRAAEKAGVSPQTIQNVEKSPPLIDRILRYMGAGAAEPSMFVPPPSPLPDAYEALIEQVIRETASQGNVVIVAHAASIPLAGMPGLLRVLITGSPERRASRLAERGDINVQNAKRAVDDSDRERKRYLERFYNVREESPTHYDLVINTDVFSPEATASIILSATKAGSANS